MKMTKSSSFGSWLLGISLVSLFGANVSQAGLVFICHPSTSLSEADVKAALQGDRPAVKPCENSSLKNDMLSFVGITDKRYASQWQIKSFREGATIPPVKGGDSDVVDFVKNTPGGMGYVSAKPSDSGVHTCY